MPRLARGETWVARQSNAEQSRKTSIICFQPSNYPRSNHPTIQPSKLKPTKPPPVQKKCWADGQAPTPATTGHSWRADLCSGPAGPASPRLSLLLGGPQFDPANSPLFLLRQIYGMHRTLANLAVDNSCLAWSLSIHDSVDARGMAGIAY